LQPIRGDKEQQALQNFGALAQAKRGNLQSLSIDLPIKGSRDLEETFITPLLICLTARVKKVRRKPKS
jgi:hypothetical protein